MAGRDGASAAAAATGVPLGGGGGSTGGAVNTAGDGGWGQMVQRPEIKGRYADKVQCRGIGVEGGGGAACVGLALAHTLNCGTCMPPPPSPCIHQVSAVRNYLGLALVHTFELRRLTMRRMLMMREVAAMDLDAEAQVGGMVWP